MYMDASSLLHMHAQVYGWDYSYKPHAHCLFLSALLLHLTYVNHLHLLLNNSLKVYHL